jgi:hypothetical protein
MTKLFLLLASSLLFLLPSSSLAEDCLVGEEEVEFTLFLDEDSLKEQGWTLQCGSDVLWNVAAGDLAEQAVHMPLRRSRPFVRDTACIAANTPTCDFTIEDSYGDGLLYPGYYVLKWGATTVAVYDRKPFHENSYCFGVDCDTGLPLEVAQDYDDVYFYLKLDAKPEETSYQIVCDGGQVLLEGGSFVTSQAYEEIEMNAVIEPYACCTFTITDGGNDGLSSPEQGFENDFSIYLDWASHRVLGYSTQTGSEFGSLSMEFGLGC